MAWPHPLRVEAVSLIQAHRERVVAELTVERAVDASQHTFSGADPHRDEVVPVQHGPAHA